MREPPPFMKGSSRRNCCPSSISSIRAMSMPSYCTAVNRTMASISLATRPDVKWQAQQKMGFAAAQFHLDWQAEQATCPEGHTSMSWTPAIDNRKNEVIKIKFSTKDCQTCPSRVLCTHSTRHPRRTITVRREQQHQALQQARARAKTEEF